ncbi:MAG: hypothetical protein IT204_06170 [Fimbriimonadaceae bacterium]|nr:hypothetical protein [Fimbriimonadaceae bacterium]
MLKMVCLALLLAPADEDPAVAARARLAAWHGAWNWQGDCLLYGKEQVIGSGSDTISPACAGQALRQHSRGVEFKMQTEAESWIGWDPLAKKYFLTMISTIHQVPTVTYARWDEERQALVTEAKRIKGFKGEDVDLITTMTRPRAGQWSIVSELFLPGGELAVRMSYQYTTRPAE